MLIICVRLRALKIGFAAALSRIEGTSSRTTDGSSLSSESSAVPDNAGEELAAALQKLDIVQEVQTNIVDIIISSSSVDVLDNKAVKFVHGDIDGDVYLENLCKWSKESRDRIKQDGSEIPSHLSQGDLYRTSLEALSIRISLMARGPLVCPESLDAIQGALGTVCEAVDKIIAASRQTTGVTPNVPLSNAFVAIRPPGHHCGEDTPSGFCFVCHPDNVFLDGAN